MFTFYKALSLSLCYRKGSNYTKHLKIVRVFSCHIPTLCIIAKVSNLLQRGLKGNLKLWKKIHCLLLHHVYAHFFVNFFFSKRVLNKAKKSYDESATTKHIRPTANESSEWYYIKKKCLRIKDIYIVYIYTSLLF